MKRLIIITALLALSLSAFSQLRRGNKPYSSIDPSEGYITINEFSAGLGLGSTASEYSKQFFGFTTIHGFQVNETFMLGGGTGLLFYDSGLLIPLFVDMRLRFFSNTWSPYASMAGGLLLNPSDFNQGTRMFINPSGGIRYTVNRNLGLTGSAGLWIQMGSGVSRSSFINARLGAVYKF